MQRNKLFLFNHFLCVCAYSSFSMNSIKKNQSFALVNWYLMHVSDYASWINPKYSLRRLNPMWIIWKECKESVICLQLHVSYWLFIHNWSPVNNKYSCTDTYSGYSDIKWDYMFLCWIHTGDLFHPQNQMPNKLPKVKMCVCESLCNEVISLFLDILKQQQNCASTIVIGNYLIKYWLLENGQWQRKWSKLRKQNTKLFLN